MWLWKNVEKIAWNWTKLGRQGGGGGDSAPMKIWISNDSKLLIFPSKCLKVKCVSLNQPRIFHTYGPISIDQKSDLTGGDKLFEGGGQKVLVIGLKLGFFCCCLKRFIESYDMEKYHLYIDKKDTLHKLSLIDTVQLEYCLHIGNIKLVVRERGCILPHQLPTSYQSSYTCSIQVQWYTAKTRTNRP